MSARNEFSFDQEAFVAANHQRLAAIRAQAPEEQPERSARDYWPSGGRVPGTNVAAVVLGVDCGDYARVFLGGGFEAAARVRALVEDIFFSPNFVNFMKANSFWIDQEAALDNCTTRLAFLAREAGIIDWYPEWSRSQVERETSPSGWKELS